MKLIVSQLGVWRGYVSREFYHVQTDLSRHGWKHTEGYRLWRQDRRPRAAD